MVSEHNQASFPCIVGLPGECNAGFDLLVPFNMCVKGYNTIKIDHLVKCRMTKIIPHSSYPFNIFQDGNGILRQYNTSIVPVGFYLYSRSSTGTKTPLRLANSVGIIDSGYRGPLISAFDNWKCDDFEIQDKQRLVQICPPDLSYPLYVILVDTEEELGKTNRGSGGFGSTGI
jgi:dUTP pyrophosphatase